MLELVAEIQGLMEVGHLDPEVLGTVKAEIHSQYLSAAKARDILKWTPANDLKAGLVKTIAWYREFLEADSHG